MWEGRCVSTGPNNTLIRDNDTQTAMMLDRVLAVVCREWFRRFRAPVPHVSLISRDAMQRALQTVIRRSQYPQVRRIGDDGPSTITVADDWDKMLENGNVLTDDEWEDRLPEESATMYRYNGRGRPSTPMPGVRQSDRAGS